MALGDAADGGIAGHLRDQVEVQGEERGAQAHAGRGDGGFAAGVSGADDGYVEVFCEAHIFILSPVTRGAMSASTDEPPCWALRPGSPL